MALIIVLIAKTEGERVVPCLVAEIPGLVDHAIGADAGYGTCVLAGIRRCRQCVIIAIGAYGVVIREVDLIERAITANGRTKDANVIAIHGQVHIGSITFKIESEQSCSDKVIQTHAIGVVVGCVIEQLERTDFVILSTSIVVRRIIACGHDDV